MKLYVVLILLSTITYTLADTIFILCSRQQKDDFMKKYYYTEPMRGVLGSLLSTCGVVDCAIGNDLSLERCFGESEGPKPNKVKFTDCGDSVKSYRKFQSCSGEVKCSKDDENFVEYYNIDTAEDCEWDRKRNQAMKDMLAVPRGYSSEEDY